MRASFVEALLVLFDKNRDAVLLNGDLGFRVLDRVRDQFPKQFFNCGIAEQNMMGVASGLAMSGKLVLVYSIIPFVTYRCLEQIRDDVCYHNLAVCVVGVGAGYSYGHMGSTHHAVEDVAIMRSLPNLCVVAPGDPAEVRGAVEAFAESRKPCYIRLGKDNAPIVHPGGECAFKLGEMITLRCGKDVAIFATGPSLCQGIKVAELLAEQENIEAAVVSAHTIKPIDTACLLSTKARLFVTIEEHSVIGGLGSAIGEAILREELNVHLLVCSTPDNFSGTVGSQTFLLEKAGLTPVQISQKIAKKYKEICARMANRIFL